MAKTDKQNTGKLGEDVAVMFLMKHKFKILGRNYLKKWGEIDIVARSTGRGSQKAAQNKGILHFIEVKTVSRVTQDDVSRETQGIETLDVPRETDEYEAEDNVHQWKLERLERAIDSWLAEHKIDDEAKYQLDLIVVKLDKGTGKAKVKYIPEIL